MNFFRNFLIAPESFWAVFDKALPVDLPPSAIKKPHNALNSSNSSSPESSSSNLANTSITYAVIKYLAAVCTPWQAKSKYPVNIMLIHTVADIIDKTLNLFNPKDAVPVSVVLIELNANFVDLVSRCLIVQKLPKSFEFLELKKTCAQSLNQLSVYLFV